MVDVAILEAGSIGSGGCRLDKISVHSYIFNEKYEKNTKKYEKI
jgi:hypothetical protein